MIRKLNLLIAISSIFWLLTIKAQEETKKEETEKIDQVSAEQLNAEKKQLQMKEQEKKAIETARNFFKNLKSKKINEAAKLLSIPFIYDEILIFDNKDITALLTDVTSAESENLFFESPVFGIHKKQKSFTENSILVKMQERNAEEDSFNILILINRDSQKIVGVFLNLDTTNQAINEKIKAKLNTKQNRTNAGASQLEEE